MTGCSINLVTLPFRHKESQDRSGVQEEALWKFRLVADHHLAEPRVRKTASMRDDDAHDAPAIAQCLRLPDVLILLLITLPHIANCAREASGP